MAQWNMSREIGCGANRFDPTEICLGQARQSCKPSDVMSILFSNWKGVRSPLVKLDKICCRGNIAPLMKRSVERFAHCTQLVKFKTEWGTSPTCNTCKHLDQPRSPWLQGCTQKLALAVKGHKRPRAAAEVRSHVLVLRRCGGAGSGDCTGGGGGEGAGWSKVGQDCSKDDKAPR